MKRKAVVAEPIETVDAKMSMITTRRRDVRTQTVPGPGEVLDGTAVDLALRAERKALGPWLEFVIGDEPITPETALELITSGRARVDLEPALADVEELRVLGITEAGVQAVLTAESRLRRVEIADRSREIIGAAEAKLLSRIGVTEDLGPEVTFTLNVLLTIEQVAYIFGVSVECILGRAGNGFPAAVLVDGEPRFRAAAIRRRAEQ